MSSGRRTTRQLAAVTFAALWFTQACGFAKRLDAVEERLLSASRRFASYLQTVPQSNYTRSSGSATGIRLKALFPDLSIEREIGGVGASAQEKLFAGAFSSFERPVTGVAQAGLGALAAKYCDQATASGKKTTIFSEESGAGTVWMPGEAPPESASTRLAVVAIRRAWLYPFTADDPEVRTIAELYDTVKAAMGTDALAKTAVCNALVTAPHFWLGAPRPLNAVARLALELGRRLPTFAEYARVLDGELGIADYARQLQGEEGYLTAVNEWHRQWLGLTSVPRLDSNGSVLMPSIIGENVGWGASELQGVGSEVTRKTIGGVPVDVLQFDAYQRADRSTLMEGCQLSLAPPLDQPFNPESGELRWEIWHVPSKAWKVLYRRLRGSDGTWAFQAGDSFSNPDGQMFQYLPADLDGIEGVGQASYATTDLSPENLARLGNPVSSVSLTTFMIVGAQSKLYGLRFPHGAIRIRRFDRSGAEQGGYSKVRLWATQEEAYVCNTLGRLALACAYRPRKGDPAVPPGVTAIPFVSATANPDAFSCGVPNVDYMTANEWPAIQYGRGAWPAGLDGAVAAWEANAYPKTPPYNELVINAIVTGSSEAGSYDRPEAAAMVRIAKDMDQEPYRLLKDALKETKDYRVLLTAPYTYGGNALHFFYQTQNYFMAAYPKGLSPSPLEPGFLSEPADAYHKIDSRNFAPFPKNLLRNSAGSFGRGNAHRYDWLFMDARPWDGTGRKAFKEVTPRPMSGILTQSAFITAMSPKIRTLAARVFMRLMCRLPNTITLTPSEEALHERYMPPNPAHIDRVKGCYQCHIHLDPLGKALAGNFLRNSDVEDPGTYAHGFYYEIHAYQYRGGTFWGMRGSMDPSAAAKGAFLGREVTGIREVGETLANSREFAQCAVTKAFENLFGRAHTFADAEMLRRVVDDFMDDYDYDAMVVRMVSSEEYLNEN